MKTLVVESFFNKVAGQHRCFPVNIAKFLIFYRAPSKFGATSKFVCAAEQW